jgi:hypothetical protein
MPSFRKIERSQQETKALNRVLKAWGMGTLDEPGTLAQMAYKVDGHDHFRDLLRICEPDERRNMYEAMSPYLRFKAKPLESYVIAAKESAAAAELPVLDEDGMLHSYMPPYVQTVAIELPHVELWIQCARCNKEGIFLGERKVDCIHTMRQAGWGYDESAAQRHLCPDCLEDEVPDAMD